MAIYRPDQAQLSFGAEGAQGADVELLDGTLAVDYIVANGAVAKGSTDITYDGLSGTLTVGDFVRIGEATSGTGDAVDAATALQYEIRRVEYDSGTVIKLDRPTAFAHADDTRIVVVTAVVTGTMSDGGSDTVDISVPSLRFVPGVYTAVTVPDLTPTMEPQYFLGNTAKRNFTTLYKGQQAFTGSLSGVNILNGWMLRFGIGQVRTAITTGKDYTTGDIALNGAAAKGDMLFAVDGVGSTTTNLSAGDIIEITDDVGSFTGTYKIQRVIGSPVTGIVVETPLKEAYTTNSVIDVLQGATAISDVFTHTITETNLLDTVTWHLRMLDSGEANPFIRRSVGGMVDSMSLSATEGEMLQAGWDTVQFMGTVHNLTDQATVAQTLYTGDSVAAGMPGFALMDDISDADIDFPSNEPYYFSQGIVYIGGAAGTRQEFARVRDFTLGISNSVEPRYYVSSRHGNGRRRGPNEMREGRREYTFSANVALPDSEATTGNDIGTALELYKQLLLEGDYGNGSQGFNVRLEFIRNLRGDTATMTIDLPSDATAAVGIGEPGVYLRAAPLPISEDPMLQTAIDCVARNIKITIVDNEAVYP